MLLEASISMKHETGFKFEMVSAGKHCDIAQILQRLKH
jgi:hypothetical protein